MRAVDQKLKINLEWPKCKWLSQLKHKVAEPNMILKI